MPTLIAALELQAFFSYIPEGIGRLIYSKFVDRIDMVWSNISGSREPLYLWNKEISKLQILIVLKINDEIFEFKLKLLLESITIFLGLFANVNMNIIINSYNGKLKVQMTADIVIYKIFSLKISNPRNKKYCKHMQMDPKQFIDLIEENIDKKVQGWI